MYFDIRDFGAKGDGTTKNTKAIQTAIDAAYAAGGGMVLVEGGRYLTGSLELKNYVELHLSANATLLGSPDVADYPIREYSAHVTGSLLPRFRNESLIYAECAKGIAVTGQGVIDCNGETFVRPREGEGIRGMKFERIEGPTPPRVVFFTGCQNVMVEGITMTNQPAGWSFWIHDCDFVSFDKVKIDAKLDYPNNDGIHINCSRNVTVSDCSISCGDDCIVIRANSVSLAENKICERVTVTNCNLTSYSGGIRIGWVNDGTIRNCTFSNLVMTDTTVGISLLIPEIIRDEVQWSDVGREATRIENLLFSNIVMDRIASNPILIELTDSPHVKLDAIRNLHYSNIHASGPELPRIIGTPECRIRGIRITDCTFEMTDGTEFPNLDTHGYTTHYGGGFYPMELRYVEDLTFQNTKFDILR